MAVRRDGASAAGTRFPAPGSANPAVCSAASRVAVLPMMWIFVIVLVGIIGGTLAMGIWFVSLPLALLLLATPLLASLARRMTGTRRMEKFRAKADHDEPDPPAGGRDHSTLYERQKQDEPPAAL